MMVGIDLGQTPAEDSLTALQSGKAWSGRIEQFAPMFALFARRYCNQLAHRRAASATGRGSCPGLTCDRAFWPAYETLILHVFGDPPSGNPDRRAGRYDTWRDREFADEEAFAAAVRGECAAPGRMTDVFRAWCSHRGLPQRARLPKGGADALAPRIGELVTGQLAIADESTLREPDMWAEALYWDAAQTGLTDPIDAERVQRWFAALDPVVAQIDPGSFHKLADSVDRAFAELVPTFHADYLVAAREQTRSPEQLDGLETDGSGRWWKKGVRL